MKGKLPLHTSPFTRRYFVNGLGAAPISAALFLRRRPFGEGGGHRPPPGRVRGRRETERAVRRRRRVLPAARRARRGAKRRKRFGEGSVHRSPRAPPPPAARPRARRRETEEAVRRRKRAPPAACRPPPAARPAAARCPAACAEGAKRRERFGEGSVPRLPPAPPPPAVRPRARGYETERAVRRRKRALPAPPRRVENGSVPFRVLRMPGGGGMIGAGGVKRAGEDETHVHSICAERRRDADRL